MADEIYFTADLLDLRNIVERREDLEGRKQVIRARTLDREDIDREIIGSAIEAGAPVEGLTVQAARDYLRAHWGIEELDEDEEYELAEIGRLADQLTDFDERARNQPTLVADRYFEEFAESEAEGIGAIDPNAGWPLNHIDWKAAAEELKQDYTEVRFGDRSWWVRN
jgi:hypothetical protein